MTKFDRFIYYVSCVSLSRLCIICDILKMKMKIYTDTSKTETNSITVFYFIKKKKIMNL